MSVKFSKANSSWYYEFMKKGQSYFKSGFRTKQQAQDAETARFDEVIRIETRPDLFRSTFNNNITFREACEWYLRTITPTKRERTSDKFMLGRLEGYFGKEKLIREITPDDIYAVREHLLNLTSDKTKEKLSIQSVNEYQALLRALIYALIKNEKYDGRNPAAKVSMPPQPRHKPRFITPEELKLIEPEVAKHKKLWPYYFIALHTGMRLGEVSGIRVKDVSLNESTIFLPMTKNGKSRHVQMSPKLRELVETLLKGKKLEDKLVDNQTTRWTVGDWFTEITKRVGYPQITFHALRHTFVHRLLNAGVAIYLVSKLVGHSSVEVTESTYGHLSNQNLQSAVDQIDGLV